MRIVGITLVKNESDIIEAFCRHNLRYVDRLVIADHRSDDNTRDIVRALIAEGLPIELVEDDWREFEQSRLITRQLRRLQKSGEADLVFFLDADEFIDYPSRDVFTGEQGQAFRINRYHYVYPAVAALTGQAPAGPANPHLPFASMPLRLPEPEMPKAIIYLGKGDRRKLKVGDGNHWIKIDGRRASRDFHGGVVIRHYPIRTARQFVRKNIVGWLAVQIAKRDLAETGEELCWHWRDAYKFILSNRMQVEEEALVRHLYGLGAEPDAISTFAAGLVLDPMASAATLEREDLITEEDPFYATVKVFEKTIRTVWTLRDELALRPPVADMPAGDLAAAD